MVGFIALLAAFFDSFIAGMLGRLLVTKQVGAKLNLMFIGVAALASLTTILVLNLLESKAYAKLPPSQWHINIQGIAVLAALIIAGFAVVYAMHFFLQGITPIQTFLGGQVWWMRWLIASNDLSLLYLMGGSLVEFTGDESIMPMLHQAASLGVAGLVWVTIVKIAAISWSKGLSYRGGLVFPSVFVASTLVAIAQQFDPKFSFTLGLIAAMAGAIAANRKLKLLF